MSMRERIFHFGTLKFSKKLELEKINGGNWVGAAAERRRFLRSKNFLSVAKKKPSDDEA